MHGIVLHHPCAAGDSVRILTRWTPTSLCSECANTGLTLISPLKTRPAPAPAAAVHPLPQTEFPPHSASSFPSLHLHSSLQTGTSLLSCEQAYFWMEGPATMATPNARENGAHASSVIKKRRKKMNKHKYRKRRREQRFLRRRHGRG